MYAVDQTGGKQYRVEEGQLIRVERLDGAPGDEIDLERVLLVGEKDQVHVGRPLVEGARVVGQIVREERGPKIRVFKYKRRKGYHRTRGHRQAQTLLRIRSIAAPA